MYIVGMKEIVWICVFVCFFLVYCSILYIIGRKYLP